jgi:hypothetical protein
MNHAAAGAGCLFKFGINVSARLKPAAACGYDRAHDFRTPQKAIPPRGVFLPKLDIEQQRASRILVICGSPSVIEIRPFLDIEMVERGWQSTTGSA